MVTVILLLKSFIIYYTITAETSVIMAMLYCPTLIITRNGSCVLGVREPFTIYMFSFEKMIIFVHGNSC